MATPLTRCSLPLFASPALYAWGSTGTGEQSLLPAAYLSEPALHLILPYIVPALSLCIWEVVEE